MSHDVRRAADRDAHHAAPRQAVHAPVAMAATSHPLATQIAVDILRAGGSAVDAAIAANAALSLMEPTGCGLGGDLVALVRDPATGELCGYNGSGRSPAGMSLPAFRERGLDAIPSHGPLSLTVPGAVDGWFALHGRFGRLPMSRLLAPAIAAAREGHAVPPVIADGWARSVPRLLPWPGFAEQFTLNGRAPAPGEIWRNPGLADTLTTLAEEGRDAFYSGRIARVVDAFVAAHGGWLCRSDLAAHRGEWVTPLSLRYRDATVWELPPNVQGLTVLAMLAILEGYDFGAIPFGSAEHVHLFTEAKKLAFADRARHFADPDFHTAPLAALLSPEHAARQRARIDPLRAATVVPAVGPLDAGDTVCLATADGDGMLVSLLQSNWRGMGSGMAPPGLGFILQDRGEQFVLREGHANSLQPGKRPFHTIIPAFLQRDGGPQIAFGLMGGAMQPQGHVQIVMNLVDFGMDIQQAGDAPRIHHAGSTEPAGQVDEMTDGGMLNLEPGFPEATQRELSRRGHRLQPADRSVFGGYQAVARDPQSGRCTGASEIRKDGHAAGL